MARDIENVNITLPGESDTIQLIVDGEPTEVVIALDSWASAVHADDADTVSGHTVARDVLADEYTNSQIDSMVQDAGKVKTVNTVQPDQNGNVQISKADLGLGNVDNTSDADKPISTAAQAALDLKVDKVDGKGLSTNDYTDADKTKLGDLPTGAEITAALAGKVDKETGKGLSTNDFTDAEKTKLQGIETGAQVNTVTGVKGSAESTYRTGNIDITKANIGLENVDNTSDLSKPISTATQAALDQKVDKVAGKGLSTNDFTTAEKEKLAGIAAGAEVNVQANWNETDSTSDAFIQNKPSIPAKTSDLQNDSGFITGVSWGAIGGTLADQIDLNNELTALNTGLSSAVKSVNTETPDANGNVAIKAENIPAQGYGNESTSGNPITITDGTPSTVKNLDVSLEPIQDLHGYDHPWAGGAGYNKWDEEWELGNISTGDGSNVPSSNNIRSKNYIPVIGGEEYFFTYYGLRMPACYDENKTFISGASATRVPNVGWKLTMPANAKYLRFDLDTNYGTTYKNDIALNYPSTVTTYSPYSNICPISGYDSVSVQRTGKNLFDKASAVDSKYIGMDGVEESTSGFTISDYIPVIGNAGYILSGILYGSPAAYHAFYDSNKTFISSVVCSTFSLTAPSTAKYVRLSFMSVYLDAVQLEEGFTATDYEPYQGNTATISLTSAGTVYGGTLDFDTGVLTVDKGYVDLGANIWGTYTVNGVQRIGTSSIGNIVTPQNDYALPSLICSCYNGITISQLSTENYGIALGPESYSYGKRFYVKDPRISTPEDASTVLAGQNLVYDLATPIIFNLTPAQLTLISDYNYITSNGTTISLDYYGSEATNVQAEIVEFETSIDRLTGSLATIETSPATATHAVGDLIVWNSQLYKVTASIAVGETLSVGTNVASTSVGSEISSLKTGKANFVKINTTVTFSNSLNTAITSFASTFGLDKTKILGIITIINDTSHNAGVSSYYYYSADELGLVATAQQTGSYPAQICVFMDN